MATGQGQHGGESRKGCAQRGQRRYLAMATAVALVGRSETGFW